MTQRGIGRLRAMPSTPPTPPVLSFVGFATGTNNLTFPAHQVGDMLVAWAANNGAQLLSPPAGWTTPIGNISGTSARGRMGWFVGDGVTTSVTWVNATSLVVAVFRGATSTGLLAASSTDVTTGSLLNLTYPARTGSATGWYVGAGAVAQADNNVQTPPTNMVLAGTHTGAQVKSSVHYTPTAIGGNWPATDVVLGGTAGGWVSGVFFLPLAP